MEEIRKHIGQAAKEIGVEQWQLRYWEEEYDLIIPRNERGYRFYLMSHITMLRRLKAYKEQGMKWNNIRQLMHEEMQPIIENQVVQREKETYQKERLAHYVNWYQIYIDSDSLFDEGFEKFIANLESLEGVQEPKILKIPSATKDIIKGKGVNSDEMQYLKKIIEDRMEGYSPGKVWLRPHSFRKIMQTLEMGVNCNRWLLIIKDETFINVLKQMPDYGKNVAMGKIVLGSINEETGFLEVISDDNGENQSLEVEIEPGDIVQIPEIGECKVTERVAQKEELLNHFEVNFNDWRAAILNSKYEMKVVFKENRQVGFLYRKVKKQ